jgi:NAD(P)-dependent dehydrogenase (short-subunit alcohol dehydrogenase family)
MSKLLDGEHALVTGAASNIGRAIAKTLAAEGASVVLADVDPIRNASVATEIRGDGGSAREVTCDLSTKDGWKDLLAATRDRTPSLFVHSACPRRHEKDTPLVVDEDTWDAMANTNVRSGLFLGRELGRRMKENGIRGRMLYITSLHAESPRNLPHYSAAKAGMTMVMKELARDLGPAGIRVNALAPGAVPGGGAANVTTAFGAKIPLGRTGTAEEMAGPALALLVDRFTGYVTGTTVAVDGGLALFNWIPFAEH